jgi:hypothetical protein
MQKTEGLSAPKDGDSVSRILRTPFSIAEVNAHLSIIDTLTRAKAHGWHWTAIRDAVWKPLEAFAPRCNCGHVLRFSPWLDGLRVAKCERCGWKTLEAPLNGD